ncbi:unnamed protein product, partial [marine sediment metagenome]
PLESGKSSAHMIVSWGRKCAMTSERHYLKPTRYLASDMHSFVRYHLLAMLICIGSIACSNLALAESNVLKREAWGAKPAVTSRMRAHKPSGIVIHHTSVRQQRRLSIEKKMRGLQSFSQRPGRVGKRRKPAWGDVPYHFYIGASGRVAQGRSLKFAGDTNTRYSTAGWIQIVLEGDFTKEKPTGGQLTSLRDLTKRLTRRYGISGERITAHNDHASTNCPGSNLKKHIPSLR